MDIEINEKEILKYYNNLDWQKQNKLLFKLHKNTIAESGLSE